VASNSTRRVLVN